MTASAIVAVPEDRVFALSPGHSTVRLISKRALRIGIAFFPARFPDVKPGPEIIKIKALLRRIVAEMRGAGSLWIGKTRNGAAGYRRQVEDRRSTASLNGAPEMTGADPETEAAPTKRAPDRSDLIIDAGIVSYYPENPVLG